MIESNIIEENIFNLYKEKYGNQHKIFNWLNDKNNYTLNTMWIWKYFDFLVFRNNEVHIINLKIRSNKIESIYIEYYSTILKIINNLEKDLDYKVRYYLIFYYVKDTIDFNHILEVEINENMLKFIIKYNLNLKKYKIINVN